MNEQSALTHQLETLSLALGDRASQASKPIGRILYRSRSLMSPSDHAGLLVQCHRNNRERHLTGLLLIRADQIIQVIEGPEPALSEVMTRIQHDHRHTAFEVLDRREEAVRLFPEWAMGSFALSERGLAALIEEISSATDVERQRIATMIRQGGA